jgi:hypothetical protein
VRVIIIIGPQDIVASNNVSVFCFIKVPSQFTANVAPSSPIVVNLMIEAIRSSEMSVLTRATRLNNAEDDILHSHCRENLKSYIALTGWTL